MNQQEHDTILAAAVAVTCQQLTDAELNSLYMVSLLGTNPKRVQGYAKVASLFTLEDGTRMHPDIQQALAAIWEQRINTGR